MILRTITLAALVLTCLHAQSSRGVSGRSVSTEEMMNRAAPFEKLQNDLGTAVAHVSGLGEADRSKLDRANLVLGQAIADRRNQHQLNKKKVFAALKDIEGLANRGVFQDLDRTSLTEDCKRAEAAAKEPASVRYIYIGKPGQPI